jgi:NADH-quinone oxidoreductase subunit J
MRTLRKLLAWSLGSAAVVVAVAVASAHLVPAVAAAPGGPSGGPVALVEILFYAIAAVTVAGAAAVALSRNIVYTSLGLLMALLGVSGLYVYLSADFVAVAQVMVYIGGVLVLILFAIMLTNRIGDIDVSNVSLGWVGGALLMVAMLPVLLAVATKVPWPTREGPMEPTTAAIGHALLQRWLLPFELVSLILLATLIGAVVIARKELKAD